MRSDYDGEAWQLALTGGATLAAGGMVKIGSVAALKAIGGTILAGVSAVTPAGWLAIGTVVIIGGVVYLKAKSKGRVTSPIGRRNVYNTRKKARAAARRAGGGKDPVHHPKGCHGNKRPHYHPNVKNEYRLTPNGVSKHDHYYYPG